MCQNNGSVKLMAVKPKHADPEVSCGGQIKHPSGRRQTGQMGSRVFGRADWG